MPVACQSREATEPQRDLARGARLRDCVLALQGQRALPANVGAFDFAATVSQRAPAGAGTLSVTLRVTASPAGKPRGEDTL